MTPAVRRTQTSRSTERTTSDPPAASALVPGAGIAGGSTARTVELPTQPLVGIGAIGALGLVESSTGSGIGITALQFAAFAVVLGLADVAAGAITGRLWERTE